MLHRKWFTFHQILCDLPVYLSIPPQRPLATVDLFTVQSSFSRMLYIWRCPNAETLKPTFSLIYKQCLFSVTSIMTWSFSKYGMSVYHSFIYFLIEKHLSCFQIFYLGRFIPELICSSLRNSARVFLCRLVWPVTLMALKVVPGEPGPHWGLETYSLKP